MKKIFAVLALTASMMVVSVPAHAGTFYIPKPVSQPVLYKGHPLVKPVPIDVRPGYTFVRPISKAVPACVVGKKLVTGPKCLKVKGKK